MKKCTTKKSVGKGTNCKPPKPYPGFPLTPHNGGKWMKKIRGKLHYFGRWGKTVDGMMERIPGDGWEEALSIYKAQAEALHAGRIPRSTSGGFLVKDLCNGFLISKQRMVDSGELAKRTFHEYYKTCDRLIATFGSNRLVEDLASDDFEKLRADVAKTWGPYRLADAVQKTRTIFKWAYESGLMDRPVRFGPNFKKPSQAVMRKHRSNSEDKLFSAEEIRTLYDAALPQLKAMILLGINCGFGNSDCAALPQKALDLDGGWVRFDRPKTGIARRAPLWPETVVAIRAALAIRPAPENPRDKGLVFLTRFGNPWVRVRDDGKQAAINSVTLEFGKLLKKCDMNRGGVGFYSLRHSFRTVADAVRDQTAIRLIMGHTDASIDARYVERIDDDRLQTVVECVRTWLGLPWVEKAKGGAA